MAITFNLLFCASDLIGVVYITKSCNCYEKELILINIECISLTQNLQEKYYKMFAVTVRNIIGLWFLCAKFVSTQYILSTFKIVISDLPLLHLKDFLLVLYLSPIQVWDILERIQIYLTRYSHIGRAVWKCVGLNTHIGCIK